MNLEDFSYFLESVLVGSKPNGMLLPSVDRLHFLNSKIKGIELKNDDDNEASLQSDEEAPDMESDIDAEHNTAERELETTGWKSWRDKLFDGAVKIANQSSNGDTINACTDFATRLKRYLILYSPLWTARRCLFLKKTQ